MLNQLPKTYFSIKTFNIYFKPKLVIFMSSKKKKVIPIVAFTIVARNKRAEIKFALLPKHLYTHKNFNVTIYSSIFRMYRRFSCRLSYKP